MPKKRTKPQADTPLCVVDLEILLYHAGHAAEEPTDWGDGMWTLHADADAAAALVNEALQKIRERYPTRRFVTVLGSPGPTWRHSVYPEYKANRKNTRKPVVHQELLIRFTPESIIVPGFEADDVIGILSGSIPGSVIVSTDKDFKTIPGVARYNPFTEEESPPLSLEEADRNVLLQVLTGDTADGYSGLPGVGPVKAEKMLNGSTRPEGDVLDLYCNFYGEGPGPLEFEKTFKLARILRHSDVKYIGHQHGHIVLGIPYGEPVELSWLLPSTKNPAFHDITIREEPDGQYTFV